MKECTFCAIYADRAEASVVYRDSAVMAFLDILPVNPGHLLVMPGAHIERLADLDDDLATKVLAVGLKLADALRHSAVPCDGVNLIVADGEAAGQEVPHTHLHVIPRTTNDGFRFDAPSWRVAPPSRLALDATAADIRQALASRHSTT